MLQNVTQGFSEGCCGHGNEHSGYIKADNLLSRYETVSFSGTALRDAVT
jgi:hypothetical protein